MIRWPAVGDVMNTNTIPNRSLTLTVPSVIKKYKKAPTKVIRTASVELFVAACARLYTSGKRIIPKALMTLIMLPIKMSNAPQNSLIPPALNDNTSFDKSGKGNGTDKGQDT